MTRPSTMPLRCAAPGARARVFLLGSAALLIGACPVFTESQPCALDEDCPAGQRCATKTGFCQIAQVVPQDSGTDMPDRSAADHGAAADRADARDTGVGPDSAQADTAVQDRPSADLGVDAAGQHDADLRDADLRDASGAPDQGGPPDSGTPDTALEDAAGEDTGSPDRARPDAAPCGGCDAPALPYCNLASGDCVACLLPEHCDDGSPCTADLCLSSFTCDHYDVSRGDEPPDCDGVCDGDGHCVQCLDQTHCQAPTPHCAADQTCVACLIDAHCDDLLPCTTDTCNSGSCHHADVTAGDTAVGCADVCDGAGACVECVADEHCVWPPHCGADNTCVECKDDSHCAVCEACDQGTCAGVAPGTPCDAGFNCDQFVWGWYYFAGYWGRCYAFEDIAIAGACNSLGACLPPSAVSCQGMGQGAVVKSCDWECARSDAGLGCVQGSAIATVEFAGLCHVDTTTADCSARSCDGSASNSVVLGRSCSSFGQCRSAQVDNCGNFECQVNGDNAWCPSGCSVATQSTDCVRLAYCDEGEGTSGMCCQGTDNPPICN